MCCNKFLIYLIWTNAVLSLLFSSTVADPLDCPSCVCGETGKEATTLSSFVSQLSGEQGDQGLSGMPGGKGARGPIGIRGSQGPPGSNGPQGHSTASAPMTSCSALRRSGFHQNGMYKIKPSTFSSEIEVYCDMEVDGGGWTLVASVHENNIDAKCVTGDNWSDNQGNVGKSKSNSWSNIWTFGEVESVTTEDYKNSAYFNLQASDVMVWHVPNNHPPSQWADQSFLKYYTNDSFLTQYGGNLRNLYKDHFPLERQSGVADGMELTPIMEIIYNSLTDIRSKIPDFFEYAYDGIKGEREGIERIISGGRDMFHTGNMVWVRAGNGSLDWHRVVYTETYTGNPAYNVTNTATTHPFITLMFIGNADGSEEIFDLKVKTQTGADRHSGHGHFNIEEGDFTLGDYKVKYRTHNTYEANGDPSVCEVHFVIYNFETWGSDISNEEDFFTPVQWSTDGENLLNHMRVSGNPRNIMLGHTLLSKADSTKPTAEQVENTLTKILQLISEFNPKQGLEPIQSMLWESSEDIVNEIPGFFKYAYDGGMEIVGEGIASIESGANPGQVRMYYKGNRVWVRAASDDWEPIVYGVSISTATWDAANTAGHYPFITLVHVKNPGGVEPYFEIKGWSNSAGYRGTSSTYEIRELSYGGFQMKYKTYNVYGSTVHHYADRSDHTSPSVSETYFVVWNYETWRSTISQSADFFETVEWSERTDEWKLTMRVNGNPRNIMMGYTLLSRPIGRPTTESQVKEAMMVILQQMSTYDPTNGLGCPRTEESAIAPVNFHTGSLQDVTNSVPPKQRPTTTPGYLQFRAINPNGLPFAMCPGVKTSSCRPSSVCIGGINILEEDPSACGDFAGYGGTPGNNPTETGPDGSARSLNDLNSSIMIFIRDSTATSSVVV